MNQPLGIALVIAGVCFLMLGMYASSSYSAGAHLIQGMGGNRTLWFLVTGTVSALAGMYLLTSKAE